MASLLDRIKDIGQTPQPQQAGIQKLLEAKTGKAVTPTGPAATSLAEQAALGATRQAVREQTFSERMQQFEQSRQEKALAQQQKQQEEALRKQEELKQQQMATETAIRREELTAAREMGITSREAGADRQIKAINNQADQRLRDLASQRNLQLDNIFSQFQFDSAELEDRRDAAQLEQQAFLLSMNDKQYLTELENIGRERQLLTDQGMREEMQRIVMGDNMDAMLDDLNFRRDRAATRRQFSQDLAQIDIDSAMDITRAAIKDDANRRMWESAGTIGSAIAVDQFGDDNGE